MPLLKREIVTQKRPCPVFVVSVASVPYMKCAIVSDAGYPIYIPESIKGHFYVLNGKNGIGPSSYCRKRAGRDQASHVVHLTQSQKIGHIVALAMIDGPNTTFNGAEIASRHGDSNPGIARRGEQ